MVIEAASGGALASGASSTFELTLSTELYRAYAVQQWTNRREHPGQRQPLHLPCRDRSIRLGDVREGYGWHA